MISIAANCGQAPRPSTLVSPSHQKPGTSSCGLGPGPGMPLVMSEVRLRETAPTGETGETATANDELDRLSVREQEVMRLIARGYAYKEVAAELFISNKTVETHVSAVLRKLQLSSRYELTAWASERRLL